MWVSITFAAIAFAGIVFMIGFLLAMLREKVRSSWQTPPEPKLRIKFRDFSNSCVGGSYAEEEQNSDDYVESLEGRIHDKDSSGLITLAIFRDLGGIGWRPRRFKRIGISQQRRFFN